MDWDFQREILDENHEVFSGGVGGTAEALIVFRTEDMAHLQQVLGEITCVLNMPS